VYEESQVSHRQQEQKSTAKERKTRIISQVIERYGIVVIVIQNRVVQFLQQKNKTGQGKDIEEESLL
jgi:hypothetical protein